MSLFETFNFILQASMLFEQIIFTHLRITHIVGQPGPEVVSFTLCVA